MIKRAIIIAVSLVVVVCLGVIYDQGGFATQENTGYTNVPEPYYISVPQQYDINILQEYLQQREWKRNYEPDVFDCTEMSAFLERVLENEGFHTYIIVGQYNNDWHAWLKVEIAPQEYVVVEATTLTVIDNTYKYRETSQYETIYDVLEIEQSSVDWWN